MNYSSWEKLFQLGQSEEETDRAYAEMLATAMEIRLERGLTQSMLAEKSGLTSSMISKMESGESEYSKLFADLNNVMTEIRIKSEN